MLSQDMSTSSLKKMNGFQRIKEGNYASLEKSLWDTPVNSDLGLTLFPGPQIQTKDDKRLGITAESSPKKAGNEQLRSFGPKIRVKNSIQETTLPNQAKNPRSSPIPGSEIANLSNVTADLNQARPLPQTLTEKNDRSAVQHNADYADAALYNEPQIGRSEIRQAKRCQHGSYSSRIAKWKKPRVCASNKLQGSKPVKVTEPTFEPHNDIFHMHYDQAHYKNGTIQSGKGRGSVGIIGLLLSGTGGGSKSRKPELHRQIKRSLDIVPERTFPPTVSSASESPAKHPHYPSLNLSKVSPKQQLKHSPVPPDTNSAEIQAQLLKTGKRVNKRSWTTFFPAKARFSPNTNSSDSTFLVTPFTPSQNRRHQHTINHRLTSTNLHPSYPPFSSTSSSDTFSDYSSLFKAFDDLICPDSLEGILNTAQTVNHRQSAPRRSASMPNLGSTRAPTIMGSSNNFGPASMPTPPSEMESFSLHTRQNHAQPFTTQGMSGSSIPMDRPMAAGGFQHHTYRLELKPNYSHEEFMSLYVHLTNQAQSLKAENMTLQSSKTALKREIEVLASQKEKLIKHIQHHERTVTQKDQQIEAMRRGMMSLQKNYKQLWDNYSGLIAKVRKENGTSNSSAIAQKIIQAHAPHTTSFASSGNQGNQPNTNVPPEHLANRAQLPMSRPELEHKSLGFQSHEQVQPLSVPAALEANAKDASIRFLQQQAYANAHNNRTISSQTMPFSAYSEASPANTSSKASVTPGFVLANDNNMSFPRDQLTRCMQSVTPSDAVVGAVTTSVQDVKGPIGHVSPERVTIDLTDESQQPLRSVLCNYSVHQTSQSAVPGGHSPSNHLPDQYPAVQNPAVNRAQSQSPPDLSAQNQNPKDQVPPSQGSQSPTREAKQIQNEASACTKKKDYSWLKGTNPFVKEMNIYRQSEPSALGEFSRDNAEGLIISTDSRKEGIVAPLPETATNQQSRSKVPRNARATLTAEAKKERARIYRKTAADKKKREKEVTKQLLQAEAMSTNVMRGQKQERRANKEGKRQEQSRNPSCGVGTQEPQRTLDGQLYQEDDSVPKAVPRGSIEQVPSDDLDYLFRDDEDSQMEIEGSETSPEADSEVLEDDVDTAYVAELEALLSADADATTSTGLEQIGTPGCGDGQVGGPCDSEESEEE